MPIIESDIIAFRVMAEIFESVISLFETYRLPKTIRILKEELKEIDRKLRNDANEIKIVSILFLQEMVTQELNKTRIEVEKSISEIVSKFNPSTNSHYEVI